MNSAAPIIIRGCRGEESGNDPPTTEAETFRAILTFVDDHFSQRLSPFGQSMLDAQAGQIGLIGRRTAGIGIRNQFIDKYLKGTGEEG